MNEEFVNVYIEVMSKKVEELTRSEIMVQTRLNVAEKLLNTVTIEKQNLSDSFEKERNNIIEHYENIINSLVEEKNNLLLVNEKLNASLNKKAPKPKVIETVVEPIVEINEF